MSSSEEEEISEPARILQHQIIYNGEVLDIALESMRTYKEGTQSLVYLDSSVHMAYALLRMLEKWSKGKGETLVRRKVKKKRARGKLVLVSSSSNDWRLSYKILGKNDNDATAVDDGDENEESEEEIHESMFTFDAFEQVCSNR